ncbi:hypothetical protein [uncultured Alsobacter sp.]|uniref:hypothetical protein n=1 Tax=uncultured Alsobacter sp. TaxID=1748258 RepID=UPI002600DC1C|nr:hypothetical protein [uncultured Alsobacter sp.]
MDVDEGEIGQRAVAAAEFVPLVHRPGQGVGDPGEAIGGGAKACGGARVVRGIGLFEMFAACGLEFSHDNRNVTKVKRHEHGVPPNE